MFLWIILLIAIAPIAEIVVLLKAGAWLGVWPTALACIATALVGGAILRFQGLAALAAAQRDLADGRAPVEAAVDGVFLIVAAPLLMTPGFITDAVGFALLVPAFRRFVARRALRAISRRLAAGEGIIVIRRS